MIFSFAKKPFTKAAGPEGGDTVHGKEKKEKEEINWGSEFV